MRRVSIIGLGWLGLPLAQYLRHTNKIVQGSKSSSEGVKAMEALGIDCQLFNTTLDFSLRDMAVKRLFQCDTLIITLPPIGHHGTARYPSIISALAKTAEYCGATQVIFTSSISVYGKHNGIINESTETSPDTETGHAILKAEETLLESVSIPVKILRLGGLLGGHRKPERWLTQPKIWERPNACVNLVQLTDVIVAISEVIKLGNPENRIYNLVAPEHPKRLAFYEAIAHRHGLSKPIFEDNNDASDYVDGSKITRMLPFAYQHSIYD